MASRRGTPASRTASRRPTRVGVKPSCVAAATVAIQFLELLPRFIRVYPPTASMRGIFKRLDAAAEQMNVYLLMIAIGLVALNLAVLMCKSFPPIIGSLPPSG